MSPYGRGGGGWGERFFSLVLTIFVLILAVEAFLVVIAPWLPWIGLAVFIAAVVGLFVGRHDRW